MNNLKEEIHKMNGIIGKLGFSIDEIKELSECGEEINEELVKEIPILFEEMKQTWKSISSSL